MHPPSPPSYHQVDPAVYAATKAQAEKDREASSGGSGSPIPFLQFPGPQGQVKWDAGVPRGYRSEVVVYLCPPWKQGVAWYMREEGHFWKGGSKPRGNSITCSGQATCPVCLGYDHQRQLGLEPVYGRQRRRFYYNVFMLSNAPAHNIDGKIRPYVLACGPQLHEAIDEIVSNYDYAAVVDPLAGRPLKLSKIKTGSQNTDVEYKCFPENPMPLPPEFYPGLEPDNMWDLSKLVKAPDLEAARVAATEMSLPLVTGSSSAAVAGVNHIGGPAVSPPWVQPQAPQAAPPPQAYQQPPQAYQQPPQAYQQPVAVAQPAPAPVAAPAPAHNPYATGASPAMQFPAPAPAPVQALPPAQAQYSPGVALPAPPAPPPLEAAPPPPTPAEVGQQPIQLVAPLDPSIVLPENRHRCFGAINLADNFCVRCPEWIKSQCAAQSTQTAAPAPQATAAPVPGSPEALQQQMINS